MGRTVRFNDDKRMKQKSGGAKFTRFKAQVGVKDIVRLVDKLPFVVRSHWVEELTRGFTCSKEWSDEKDAYVGACPLCEDGHKATERFAVKIIHIARDREAVKKFRLWQFGLDKYQLLSDIEDETNKMLNDQDLVIKCTDEKYQKLNILPSSKHRKVEADEDSDFDIDAVTEIPAYDKLQEQVAEARGGSSGSSGTKVEAEDIEDDDDLDELVEKKPTASGNKRDAAPATADDEDEDYDIDDLLNDD